MCPLLSGHKSPYEQGQDQGSPKRSIMKPDYAAHERFVDPARHSAEPQRLLFGILLVILGYVMLLWLFQSVIMAVLPAQSFENFLQATRSGETATGALFILGSFGFLALAVVGVVHQIHLRAPSSLIGPIALARKQGSRVCLAVGGVMLAIWILPPSEIPDGEVLRRPVAEWLMWLPVAVPALLLQTTTEELAFRGYLQQQLAARFPSPLVWMLAPAVLFGLVHYRADAGENALLLMAWAALFSLIASDLTARSGTLGPAIGLHFAFNAAAIFFLAQDADLSGLALVVAPIDLSEPALIRPQILLDMVLLITAWLAARLALRR